MILTGKEIKKRQEKGDIIITPFNENKVNPNSYNLRLANEIMILEPFEAIDIRKPQKYHKTLIDDKNGFCLSPGELYLARTLEYTETHNLVPMLEGRSSFARLGLFVHITAGFGDIGYCGYWTLELACIKPIVIYPEIEICQIYYHTIEGEPQEYNGKYQNSQSTIGSKIYKEFTDADQ